MVERKKAPTTANVSNKKLNYMCIPKSIHKGTNLLIVRKKIGEKLLL